jgi:enoyl-CoA hydratase/3-hydroxyacyl-CoA dehydrogenase
MDIDEVERIAVLGAGNMGHGIAEVAALAGYEVALRDIDRELVEDGLEQIEWSLGKLAQKEQIAEADADGALERIEATVDLGEAVADADVVIEVVPERMEVKKEVYRELSEHAPERAVFVTNTSSLSITDLARTTDRPARFCGMHFFNPPVRMQLVEVIRGRQTDDDTVAFVEELAESMGKTAVRVRKDTPGFIVNRVLVPLMNEAAWIVESGDATIAEVDATTKYDIGLPLGAFELADRVGIDIGYHVLSYMHEELGDAYEPCPLIEEKVEAGDLGEKSGRGFYDYEDGGATIPADLGSDAIRKRLLAGMANEVAALVADDVADPSEIDRAVRLGAGFPEGPARLADEAGIAELVATLDSLHERTGAERYEAVQLLRDLAAEEAGFYEAEGGVDLEFEHVVVEREGAVGRITIDRPHRMNTLTPDLLSELDVALDRLEADDDVRAVLLRGAGDRAFSAGVDVQAVAGGGMDPVTVTELARTGQRVFGRFRECPLPVVAAIDGYCLGGGMELATCADLRIASSRAEFGQPELNLGLIPGWGGTQRLQRIVGEGRAKEIILTADRYDAEEMADYGFLNEVVEGDGLAEAAMDQAAELAAGPPIAQRYAKRAIHAGWEDMEAGLELEAQSFGQLMATDDLMAGVTAFMGDEEPEFEGK